MTSSLRYPKSTLSQRDLLCIYCMQLAAVAQQKLHDVLELGYNATNVDVALPQRSMIHHAYMYEHGCSEELIACMHIDASE